MPKKSKQILRVLDVNFNRCKEGLRVVEDVFRFVLEDDNLRKQTRRLRHKLDFIARKETFQDAILSRDSKRDLGKKSDYLENKRENLISILYINFQRVKESLRVLEEFLKLVSLTQVSAIKKIRYEIYILEQKAFKFRPPLRNLRQKDN
ncbi:MAG: thiamine-phosphate pyrophosphorylase [Candidatus Omnitrophota bacterium]